MITEPGGFFQGKVLGARGSNRVEESADRGLYTRCLGLDG